MGYSKIRLSLISKNLFKEVDIIVFLFKFSFFSLHENITIKKIQNNKI
ncbi:hypothetical protein Cabys_426 [Caldithrix abyssi DSM 13497]|uniref:Uncharacterized protein n=1 Tax=Caldithrix abyssi DSM 13497 TaxID=880073 RepID=A0A1J1C4H0_CALAY|nr:hypothetical protein Cabys_426 [Caldithrix abyssi DSM 13497]